MSKKKAGVTITPIPLNADAYIVSRKLTEAERREFRLAWAKMNEQSGTHKLLITIPEDVELKELTTPHLKVMREQIDRILEKRKE